MAAGAAELGRSAAEVGGAATVIERAEQADVADGESPSQPTQVEGGKVPHRAIRPIPVAALSGAMASLQLVVVVQYLSLPRLDEPLVCSLFCFACGIPGAATVFVMEFVGNSVRMEYLLGIVMVSLLILCLIGVAALFFHFSASAGVAFLASGIIFFLVTAGLCYQTREP